jgi:hypothetical protein
MDDTQSIADDVAHRLDIEADGFDPVVEAAGESLERELAKAWADLPDAFREAWTKRWGPAADDHSALLLIWYVRRSLREQARRRPDLHKRDESPHFGDTKTNEEWLDEYFPRVVPAPLEQVAQTWLEACALRGRSWVRGRWDDACRLAWFGDAAQRLVWRVENPQGVRFLKPEGDRFLDVHDDVVEVGFDSELRVAHATEIPPPLLQQWSRHFSDFETVQPFHQIVPPLRSYGLADLEEARYKLYDADSFGAHWVYDKDFSDPLSDYLALVHTCPRGEVRLEFNQYDDTLFGIRIDGRSSVKSTDDEVDPVLAYRVVGDLEASRL